MRLQSENRCRKLGLRAGKYGMWFYVVRYRTLPFAISIVSDITAGNYRVCNKYIKKNILNATYFFTLTQQ